MSGLKLVALLVLVSIVVGGGGVAGALGVLGGDESSGDEPGTASGAAKRPPAESRAKVAISSSAPEASMSDAAEVPTSSALRTDVRPRGCTNLILSPAAGVELERLLGQPTVKGSIYYGACNGRYWATARFLAGGDGVYADVRSGNPVELGSIAEARCKVPYGLLELWKEADHCIAASSDPSAVPDEPQSTVKVPDPRPPDPQTRGERCAVPEVKVPNYNPTDGIPDQRLPRPEELLPPRDICPEAYEGSSGDTPHPGGQHRYSNGRTYIEQINFCNLMRSQGVPCTVPPPP